MMRILAFLILLPVSGICFSQHENLTAALISEIEQMADNDPEMAEQITEKLADLSEKPVNINSRDARELSRLFFLSDFQVRSIADYVKTTGSIVSVYELGNIPGIDPGIIRMMLPFITVRTNNNNEAGFSGMMNRLIMNFNARSDYSGTSSLGPPYRILLKYRFDLESISGGFTAEKDAGEPLFYGNPPLPDFISFNVALKGTGILKKIIIGDYSARFGLGTCINTGFRTGLSVSSPGFITCRDEIKQYTSTDEYNFFRGLAIESGFKNMSLRMFYSFNRSDAALKSSDNASLNYISSFYNTGLHNSISMIQRKDNYSGINLGMNLFYNFKKAGIGFTFSQSRISIPVHREPRDPEKAYRFSGTLNNLLSAYYNALMNRVILAGEFTLNNNTDYALVQTVSIRPADRLTFSFLFRHYNPGFASFYGKGPGISATNANETGLLGSFSFEAMKHLFIYGGMDLHFFPWLKYRTTGPSSGTKQEVRVRYIPSENIDAEFSFNLRTNMIDSGKDPGIPEPQKIFMKTLKAIIRYRVSENLRFMSRIDYSTESHGPGKGILLLSDAAFSFRRIPVSLWLRCCIFSTDSWDSRIYTYENDLLYSFSVPALSGMGSRYYIMAGWKITDRTDFRIKYGITSKISDGNLLANTEEIKLQFAVEF